MTPAISVDTLCEALDGLPDEATEVLLVTSEHGTELFWRAKGGEWYRDSQVAKAGAPSL